LMSRVCQLKFMQRNPKNGYKYSRNRCQQFLEVSYKYVCIVMPLNVYLFKWVKIVFTDGEDDQSKIVTE